MANCSAIHSNGCPSIDPEDGGDLVLRNRPAGGLEAVLTLPRR